MPSVGTRPATASCSGTSRRGESAGRATFDEAPFAAHLQPQSSAATPRSRRVRVAQRRERSSPGVQATNMSPREYVYSSKSFGQPAEASCTRRMSIGSCASPATGGEVRCERGRARRPQGRASSSQEAEGHRASSAGRVRDASARQVAVTTSAAKPVNRANSRFAATPCSRATRPETQVRLDARALGTTIRTPGASAPGPAILLRRARAPQAPRGAPRCGSNRTRRTTAAGSTVAPRRARGRARRTRGGGRPAACRLAGLS